MILITICVLISCASGLASAIIIREGLGGSEEPQELVHETIDDDLRGMV